LEPAGTDHNDYEVEKARQIKEQKALDRFLIGSGCCIFCHIFDPLVLEEHHIAGRKHSDATITVCPNHHAVLTRKQGSWPKEWLQEDLSVHKKVALFFRGVSDACRVMSDELFTLDNDDKDKGVKQ
jgi:hypothetical protein